LLYIDANFPAVSSAFRQRLRAVTARIGAWPESAEEVAQRPGVRMVPLIRYPYRIFYRIGGDAVEILHIHHAARTES
jgi:toxin ParE1/3/4